MILKKPSKRWPVLSAIAFLGVAGLFLWQTMAMGLFEKDDTLPVYDPAPEFSLIERSGRTISQTDLLGQVWIADFIFTRCEGICPMLSLQMSGLTRQVDGVQFVSFTVDPEYDTPEVLSQYANSYKADPKEWYFLTGEKETLNAVSQGFKLTSIDQPMMHSGRFILVDKEGQVRGYYDARDPEKLTQLKRDVKHLT